MVLVSTAIAYPTPAVLAGQRFGSPASEVEGPKLPCVLRANSDAADPVSAFTQVTGLWPQVTADTRNCPETAMKLPGGGHENCPLTVMGSARHFVVCLAASRG